MHAILSIFFPSADTCEPNGSAITFEISVHYKIVILIIQSD